MRELASVAAVVGAALVVLGAAVFGLHDRHTLVPPPQAVGEGFMRQLVHGHYDLATNYMVSEARGPSRRQLAEMFEPARRQLRAVHQVSADPPLDERDGQTVVQASADAANGRATLSLRLVQEHGLWRVREVPGRAVLVPTD